MLLSRAARPACLPAWGGGAAKKQKLGKQKAEIGGRRAEDVGEPVQSFRELHVYQLASEIHALAWTSCRLWLRDVGKVAGARSSLSLGRMMQKPEFFC